MRREIPMAKKDFHLLVIGSGPGGYIAALKAAQLGAEVAVVEKHPFFGGTCLNWGCIPSKALLATGELLHTLHHEAAGLGIAIGGKVSYDWSAVQKRKDKVLETLRSGIKGLFAARNVTMFHGRCTLDGPGQFTITGEDGQRESITADKTILAVGSVPARIPGWPDDPAVVCTSDEALHWTALPRSLLIVGGGVIGCEFACMMQSYGVKVTVVEMMDRLLPEMDAELAQAMQAVFKKRGIEVLVGTKVESMTKALDGVEAVIGGQTLTTERVLVATGRRPATADIGLETVNIQTDSRGFIPVEDDMETSADGYYCIGDANGRCLLAHAASAQAIVAVENAFGANKTMHQPIPWAVYTYPEIAGVGTTEQRAKDKGLPVSIGTFPLGHLGKALAANHAEGFVKTIRHRETDELLGVHMIGHNATEIIHAAVAMIGQQASTHELAEMVFAHPTLSEAVKESAEDAFGEALHLPPRKVVTLAADAEEN